MSAMKTVFEKTRGLTDLPNHYCPGCSHGIVHRITAEALVELDLLDKAIVVGPVGCAVFCYKYFNCDSISAAHGRACAVACGAKRAGDDNIVFTYQGDGDLAAIGTAESVHAAVRGDNITVIFINNAIYGMTGGQMAPTTLLGQVTQTTPYGREADANGMPIRVAEMFATLDAPAYIERVSVDSVKNIVAAKRAIKKAFQYQAEGKGYTMIEVLGTCATNWGLGVRESLDWLRDNLMPYYPLGVYKDKYAKGGK